MLCIIYYNLQLDQPKCSSMLDWINTLCYAHIMKWDMSVQYIILVLLYAEAGRSHTGTMMDKM